MDELKLKFRAFQQNDRPSQVQLASRNLSTKGSWSNREEEWYVMNKLLLFATQSEQASNTWIYKLNELLLSFNKFETPRNNDFFPDQLIEHYASVPLNPGD